MPNFEVLLYGPGASLEANSYLAVYPLDVCFIIEEIYSSEHYLEMSKIVIMVIKKLGCIAYRSRRL
jgi:hypothetical protein